MTLKICSFSMPKKFQKILNFLLGFFASRRRLPLLPLPPAHLLSIRFTKVGRAASQPANAPLSLLPPAHLPLIPQFVQGCTVSRVPPPVFPKLHISVFLRARLLQPRITFVPLSALSSAPRRFALKTLPSAFFLVPTVFWTFFTALFRLLLFVRFCLRLGLCSFDSVFHHLWTIITTQLTSVENSGNLVPETKKNNDHPCVRDRCTYLKTSSRSLKDVSIKIQSCLGCRDDCLKNKENH